MKTIGGEISFILSILIDSLILQKSLIWYSSMIGMKSTLKIIMKILKLQKEIQTIQSIRFTQGRTMRWGIAWSYYKFSSKKINEINNNINNSIILLNFQITKKDLLINNLLNELNIHNFYDILIERLKYSLQTSIEILNTQNKLNELIDYSFILNENQLELLLYIKFLNNNLLNETSITENIANNEWLEEIFDENIDNINNNTIIIDKSIEFKLEINFINYDFMNNENNNSNNFEECMCEIRYDNFEITNDTNQ